MLMRIVARYSREDRVKYISHLDLMRTLQRALRRAEIPIAYSQGFNPHPKLSFASALPVGVTSSGEYMDIILENSMEPQMFTDQMNNCLPRGLQIIETVEVNEDAPSLMSLVERALYIVEFVEPVAGLQDALIEFMVQPEIMVEKQGKKGIREIDIKQGIHSMEWDTLKNVLTLSLSAGSKLNIKPDTVIHELFGFMNCEDAYNIPLRIHRDELFINHGGQFVSPLGLKKGVGADIE